MIRPAMRGGDLRCQAWGRTISVIGNFEAVQQFVGQFSPQPSALLPAAPEG